MDRQYTNQNLLQPADVPKSLKIFQGLEFTQRLRFLNSEGLFEVAEELHGQLQRFKTTEKQLAKTNLVKAWAQGRLRIRGANSKAVESLTDWLYSRELHDNAAEDLYQIWILAKRLDITSLADECTERLSETASASIKTALSSGIPLHSLLKSLFEQDGSVQADDAMTTVFRHVLEDDNPPIKLSNLVVETMAKGMDTELWQHLQSRVNHDVARRLIEAMVLHRQVKEEPIILERSSIKCEGQHDLRSA